MEAAITTFLDSTIPTILSTATIAIATMTSSMDHPNGHSGDLHSSMGGPPVGPLGPPPPNGECSLLGPFALIVQGALGVLALSSLVFKRWRERPQRPIKIWFFDVSKQVVGSILVHVANLLMSMLSSGQLSISVTPEIVSTVDRMVRRMEDREGQYQPNPCSFYLLNLAIDTTVGIPILIISLRILTALFALTPFGNPPESIRSGNYGSPPRTWWWFKQCIIYFLGLLSMKFCVLVIFLVVPWISRVGDWALRWTEGNEELQVFFVMLFFPLVMNATQYYIIDTFIQNQNPEHESIPSDDEESSAGDERPGRDSYEAEGSSDDTRSLGDEEVTGVKDAVEVKAKPVKTRGDHKNKHHYDPATDGDNSPTIVGSGSHSERGVSRGADGEDEVLKKTLDW